MPANLEFMKPGAAAQPGRIDRHQPEARTDRWKLELERAAMAGGARAGAHQSAAPRVLPEAAPQGAGTAHSLAHAGAAASGAAAGVTLLQHAPMAHQAHAQLFHGAPGIAALAARAVGAPGAAAPSVAGAATLLWPGAPAEAADAERAPGAAPAPEAPAPDDSYARSLLHVVRSGDGVHAWIRDASLSQAQVRRVAQAMVGEFAQTGAPLAGLTVNGKKIMSSGAAGDQAGSVAADRYDEAAPAVRPLTQFAFKGA